MRTKFDVLNITDGKCTECRPVLCMPSLVAISGQRTRQMSCRHTLLGLHDDSSVDYFFVQKEGVILVVRFLIKEKTLTVSVSSQHSSWGAPCEWYWWMIEKWHCFGVKMHIIMHAVLPPGIGLILFWTLLELHSCSTILGWWPIILHTELSKQQCFVFRISIIGSLYAKPALRQLHSIHLSVV